MTPHLFHILTDHAKFSVCMSYWSCTMVKGNALTMNGDVRRTFLMWYRCSEHSFCYGSVTCCLGQQVSFLQIPGFCTAQIQMYFVDIVSFTHPSSPVLHNKNCHKEIMLGSLYQTMPERTNFTPVLKKYILIT